ncbi:MAG TPA: proprotein convertase P-domain-containing protein [Kofleriaceae bacterium]
MKRTTLWLAVAAWLAPALVSADSLRSTRTQPLVEVAHTVDISIADGVATYKVRRQFSNPGKVADEAGLAIDLPAGGAATGLRIRAKDRWYDGVLMEREKAAALYQELTGMGSFAAKDPALLQWLWADKLYLQVFPIFPGGVSTVEYTLTVPTRYASGRYWISYPRIDAAATDTRPLATPTIVIRPAWGDATTKIAIDGRAIAPETPVVLTPPPREAWHAQIEAEPSASYVASSLEVPESAATKQTVAKAKLTLDIAHTYQGDLRVELLTPQGKRVPVHAQAGGTKNAIKGVREVTLPAGTIAAGIWRLVVSDHAAMDAGSIDGWSIELAKTTVAAADVPVFIPDAPEGAGDAGVATISIAPPAIATLALRLGRVVASDKHAFSRLEIDVAPALSKLPKKAQVVFVVDASISVGEATLAAQLAILRAYLTHVPDAEVEVIAYRRRASRVFGGFVPASQVGTRLDTAIKAHAFALGNGSALDEGAKLATVALADRRGPRRIVMLTDELVRTTLTPEGALAAFGKLSRDTIVHVVVPEPTGDDRPELVRDDKHALAKLATRHHGILARVSPGGPEKNLPPVVLELVRPTRIENLAITGVKVDASFLREGDGVRVFTAGKTAPQRVTLSGQLWSDPVRREAIAGEPFSRATAAFVFGEDEHQDLSPAEMMKVAMFGRAVSPVTSYVAFEPGTRPSTIGLPEESGFGFGRSGFGSGGGGSGYGVGIKLDLRPLIDVTACTKAHPPAAGWNVTLVIETTKQEVVDVTPVTTGALASCLVETVWALKLPEQFAHERETFRVTLR